MKLGSDIMDTLNREGVVMPTQPTVHLVHIAVKINELTTFERRRWRNYLKRISLVNVSIEMQQQYNLSYIDNYYT